MSRRVWAGVILLTLGLLIGAVEARHSLLAFLASLAIIVIACILLLDALIHSADEELPSDLSARNTDSLAFVSHNTVENPETVTIAHEFTGRDMGGSGPNG